ncbi:hypothetical protein ACLB2K_077074 [Fragaria x ananassa]
MIQLLLHAHVLTDGSGPIDLVRSPPEEDDDARPDELNAGNDFVFVKIVAINVLGVWLISSVHSYIMTTINRLLIEFTLLVTCMFLYIVIERLLQSRRLETENKQLENELKTKKNDDLNTPTAPPNGCAVVQG